MLATLQRISTELDGLLRALDASALHPNDAVKLLDRFNAIERRAVAGRALVADRAAASNSWTRSGHRSPQEWLAAKTGTSYGQAKDLLETSSKLEALPAVQDAVRSGQLSASELTTIGPAATPTNETRLLKAAAEEAFGGLKRTCTREKAATRSAEDQARRHERIHRERFHRSWTDAEGAYCYEGKTTTAIGARIDAAIAAQAELVFKAAYAEGRRESSAAYRADAFVDLICGGGATVDTTVVVRVDATRLAGGEGVCETSTGDVPVDEASGAILAGAFTKVVLTDGTDVTKVIHVGRRIPVELKTAVTERDNHRCVRPGCSSAHRLEVHHYHVDFAKGGPTAYSNLATLCSFDHDLVTYGGHRLDGGPGAWEWVQPP
ncbi:MAG TPA: HNH endonuclease signature motif containing protein [Acidimicrobiales bacterium]|nr:HNH endonuclease signature motif containing protein [Acidimicrobiales bacterium]